MNIKIKIKDRAFEKGLRGDFSGLFIRYRIGHFRVAVNLTMKASLSAKLFI